MIKKNWKLTEEDKNFIKENYSNYSNVELSKILNKSKSCIIYYGHFYQLKKTDETLFRLRSKANKGRKLSKNWINNLIKSRLGKKRSEETKRKMSKIRIKLMKEGKIKHPKTEFKKGHNLNQGINHPMFGKKRPNQSEMMRLNNPMKIKEVYEKFLEFRKTQILPVKDTKIEVKIQNFLKELGYEFFTHQYIKQIEHGYQCDILVPSMNLVIECDGNYWHKYPIGNDIDHIRTKELLEKGFKVLRLWEVEIKEMDINKFKELIYNIK